MRLSAPWQTLDSHKKVQTFVCPEWCWPGRRIVPTPRGSILQPSRASQRPFSQQTFVVYGFGMRISCGFFCGFSAEKKVLKGAQTVPGLNKLAPASLLNKKTCLLPVEQEDPTSCRKRLYMAIYGYISYIIYYM